MNSSQVAMQCAYECVYIYVCIVCMSGSSGAVSVYMYKCVCAYRERERERFTNKATTCKVASEKSER